MFALYLVVFSAALLLFLNVTGGVAQRLLGERTGASKTARPILGVAVMVVFMHWQALVLPAGNVLPVVVGGAVLLVVALFLRPRTLPRLVGDPVAILAGILGWVSATLPNLMASTHRIVLPSSSHDAFYYTSVADWLRDHRGTDAPRLHGGGSLDAPYFGAAAQTIEYPVRYGQELLHAWFSSAIGASPSTTFASVQAVYVGLVAYAVARLLRALDVSGLARPLLALAVTANPWFLGQVWAQNADAILGIALAVELITVIHLTLGATDEDGIPLTRLLTIAILTGALVGTYFELASAVGGLMLVRFLWPGRSTLLRRATLGAGCVAVSVALALPAWARAVRGASFLSKTIDNVAREPLDGTAMLGRFDLVLPPSAPARATAMVVVALVVTSVIVLLQVPGRRWLAVGVVGTLAAIALVIRSGDAYSFGRSLALSSVFVGAAAAVAAYAVLGARRWSRWAVSAIALVVIVGNGVAASAALDWPWRDRVVTHAYLQASDWASAVDSSGRDVAVVAPQFFDELVLADNLQERPRTVYPMIRADLGYLATLDAQAYNAGPTLPRYVLLGPGTTWRAPASAVVHRNRLFTMIDTTASGWVLAYPAAPLRAWNYIATRTGTRWLLSGGQPAEVAVVVARDVTGFCLRTGAPGPTPRTETSAADGGWSAALEPGNGLCLRRPMSAPIRSIVSIRGGSTVTLGRVPTMFDTATTKLPGGDRLAGRN